MDSYIKKELMDGINQLHIKKEKEMALPVIQCSELTELKDNVEILNVDASGISISGDGVTHVFLHGPRIYEVKPLKSTIRIVLKQMIKQKFDINGEAPNQYPFDLKVEFKRGSDLAWSFQQRLHAVGYNI